MARDRRSTRASAAAHGSILALTDDDVLVADDWIPTIREIFTDPSIALVGGRVEPNWERPAPRWLRIERNGHFTKWLHRSDSRITVQAPSHSGNGPRLAQTSRYDEPCANMWAECPRGSHRKAAH